MGVLRKDAESLVSRAFGHREQRLLGCSPRLQVSVIQWLASLLLTVTPLWPGWLFSAGVSPQNQ